MFLHLAIACISVCMNRLVAISDGAVSVSYVEGIIPGEFEGFHSDILD